MNKNSVPIIIAIILLVGAGVWFLLAQKSGDQNESMSSNDAKTETEQKPTEVAGNSDSQTQPVEANKCVRDFDPVKLASDKVNIKNRKVALEVKDFGTITVELYDQDAPKTVENFLRLTNSGFYNCLTFHRIAKGFVIQGGDPLGNGTGGESVFGGEFADELNPKTKSYQAGYQKGVLAMANRGPNTNTSQFFILLGDATFLQKNYTIFGKVTIGQEVVDKIGSVDITPTNPANPTDGAPKTPIIIQKATIN